MKKESCTFSRAVVRKLLLPCVSNTTTNVYQKTFNFVNTDTPCRKKAEACYVARFKNSKLLPHINCLIFHQKEFLVKLSIPKRRRKVLCNFCSTLDFSQKNHKTTGFNVFLVRIRAKNLPANVLVKFVECSGIQEDLLYWLL